jgi:coenzyme Q-binding protein COQ10
MRHSVRRVLPYTPEQLFALVGDVEAYPRFVPWITSMRVWNPRDDGEGVTGMDAEAGVRFTVLRERFSTRVKRDAKAREITVSLISGPFKHLLNHWKFTEHPTGTVVDFTIDFEFKSKLLTKLLTANFHHAVERLMQCFEQRAKALYGPGAAREGSG